MSSHAAPVLRLSATTATFVVCLLALGIVFNEALREMASIWFSREEYSHGVIVPLVAIFLAWQKLETLTRANVQPSWSGLGIVIVAAALNLLGQLGSVFFLQQYAFVLAIVGLVVALGGWKTVRVFWAPLVLLLFMIPLPNFVLNNLSADLQLLSSRLGVVFIRLFDISVFVEGNVIDLGGYKLQVAEACDGLRYLFPLLTLGFIMACLFQAPLWKRALLLLSAVPITILMNSLRIGTIGVMVEHWGTAMAEGFLHDFQGWTVFMTSAALMLLEMMLLARIGKSRKHWRQAFALDVPQRFALPTWMAGAVAPRPFVVSALVLCTFAVAASLTPSRAEATPDRESFYAFPLELGRWTGQRTTMERIYLDALRLDDYLLADYVANAQEPLNLYVAWYNSQQAGQSAHSPRSCLPGGGWRIRHLSQVTMPGARAGDAEIRVNRAVIELGTQKQLVYYWFQQRGRVITSEYLVKWYLFWDSLTRRRSDGALVRLVTPIRGGDTEGAADARLTEFVAAAAPHLDRFVPN